jgi:hypothetical protein
LQILHGQKNIILCSFAIIAYLCHFLSADFKLICEKNSKDIIDRAIHRNCWNTKSLNAKNIFNYVELDLKYYEIENEFNTDDLTIFKQQKRNNKKYPKIIDFRPV